MSSVIPKSDNTVIEAQTAAGTHDFFVPQNGSACVAAANLGASDTVDIQMKVGASYADLYEDGSQVQLTQTWTMRRLVGPGQFRINKPITTNSVSVHVD